MTEKRKILIIKAGQVYYTSAYLFKFENKENLKPSNSRV
jgi:hypothetical protein